MEEVFVCVSVFVCAVESGTFEPAPARLRPRYLDGRLLGDEDRETW